MSYQIQLFAGVAEQIGSSQVEIALPEPASLIEIRETLCSLYPQIQSIIQQCFFAVNESYTTIDTTVSYQDQIAVIPPVSGGEPPYLCTLTNDEINVNELMKHVSNRHAGAILAFVGIVREFTGDKQTIHLEYEGYAKMAIQTMYQICDEIQERWPAAEVAMTHRLGVLQPEDISIAIVVATPHRPAAFEAGRYAIERFKKIVPIWKKEKWSDGSEWIGEQSGTPWNPLI
ncbi:molybdenum cofactor biosynthesis protein MoaE [Fodinisporobacter ferrooxydans]|uniref:Molybdenum cofactor biosynthesis protein MoaE n=1 Tax=Fodinisporobacter ferrooxydans TaxID=2901836 RepID=A0ABY4CHC7_9BACL|nr:molybdenum cofactor biosynthesis protein MoaE [Alicyclobacillaceae bacterium MYW30-H2]